MDSVYQSFAYVSSFTLNTSVSINSVSQPCHIITFSSDFAKCIIPDNGGPAAYASIHKTDLVSTAEAKLQLFNSPPRIMAANQSSIVVNGLPAYSIAIERFTALYTLEVGDIVIFEPFTSTPPQTPSYFYCGTSALTACGKSTLITAEKSFKQLNRDIARLAISNLNKFRNLNSVIKQQNWFGQLFEPYYPDLSFIRPEYSDGYLASAELIDFVTESADLQERQIARISIDTNGETKIDYLQPVFDAGSEGDNSAMTLVKAYDGSVLPSSTGFTRIASGTYVESIQEGTLELNLSAGASVLYTFPYTFTGSSAYEASGAIQVILQSLLLGHANDSFVFGYINASGTRMEATVTGPAPNLKFEGAPLLMKNDGQDDPTPEDWPFLHQGENSPCGLGISFATRSTTNFDANRYFNGVLIESTNEDSSGATPTNVFYFGFRSALTNAASVRIAAAYMHRVGNVNDLDVLGTLEFPERENSTPVAYAATSNYNVTESPDYPTYFGGKQWGLMHPEISQMYGALNLGDFAKTYDLNLENIGRIELRADADPNCGYYTRCNGQFVPITRYPAAINRLPNLLTGCSGAFLMPNLPTFCGFSYYMRMR